MKVWLVRADRRVIDHPALLDELGLLADGVEGLQLHVLDDFERAPDAGTFRDFVPIATLSHAHTAALEYVAELLLETHDWHVDFQDVTSTNSNR